MALHNRVNRQQLKQRLKDELVKRRTLSFYKYFLIEDPQKFRDNLYKTFSDLRIFGRVYIAQEGINAQLSVPLRNFKMFNAFIKTSLLKNVNLNAAIEDDDKSFFTLQITVKKKILTDGLVDKTFNVTDCGEYLDAKKFNRLTEDPETILVDMRNHYESEVGHFAGAILPDCDTFRETLRVVEKQLNEMQHKNIVLYCTGGIRCEKASAYYKYKGFKNVYQLEGGIVKYIHEVREKDLKNKFMGKNFVFDARLGEKITDKTISICHQCGKSCDTHTNCKNDGCHLLFIQCVDCAKKYNGCCSEDCMKIIELPEEKQKEIRRGKDRGQMIYRKGRSDKLIYKA